MSTVKICLYTNIYIYILLIIFILRVSLLVMFFARPMHFTSEFAMTVLSKCVFLSIVSFSLDLK